MDNMTDNFSDDEARWVRTKIQNRKSEMRISFFLLSRMKKVIRHRSYHEGIPEVRNFAQWNRINLVKDLSRFVSQ